MRRFSTILLLAVLCAASTASWADLVPYFQDFEELPLPADDPFDGDPPISALAADGWLVFGNVSDPGGGFLYPYGPFPAPNGGEGFCAVVAGEGGPEQGFQQLSVYSDYDNGDHGNGNLIEANVFQEQVVGAADVGSTWVFEYAFKRGNIEGASTAQAFIKTLDPAAGFALTNFLTADMTDVPDAWGGTQLSIYIDPSLEGQILQFGFLSVATNFEGSGIFYDNVRFVNAVDQCPPDDGDEKVTICHVPGGNPRNAHTIVVDSSAVPAHLAHGDSIGPCEDVMDDPAGAALRFSPLW